MSLCVTRSDQSQLLHRVRCLEAVIIGQEYKRVSELLWIYVYRLCTVQSVSSELSTQENSIIEVVMRAYWHSICIGCTPTKRYIRSIISLGFVKALAFPKRYIKGRVSLLARIYLTYTRFRFIQVLVTHHSICFTITLCSHHKFHI